MLNEKLIAELKRYSMVGTPAKRNILYWFPQTHTEDEVSDFYIEAAKIKSNDNVCSDIKYYMETVKKILSNKKVFMKICETCGFAYNVLIKNAQSAIFTVEIPFDRSVAERRHITLDMVYDSTKYSDEMFLFDLKQAVLQDQEKTHIHYFNTNALLDAINDYCMPETPATIRPCIWVVK